MNIKNGATSEEEENFPQKPVTYQIIVFIMILMEMNKRLKKNDVCCSPQRLHKTIEGMMPKCFTDSDTNPVTSRGKTFQDQGNT